MRIHVGVMPTPSSAIIANMTVKREVVHLLRTMGEVACCRLGAERIGECIAKKYHQRNNRCSLILDMFAIP